MAPPDAELDEVPSILDMPGRYSVVSFKLDFFGVLALDLVSSV